MRAAVALAAALALAGCQPSEQDRVGETVTRFIGAYADGHAKTACSLLVPEVREAFEGGCEAGLTKEHAALDAAEKERLRSLEVGTVDVSGDTARVRLQGQAGEPGTLRKVDGVWLIENR